MSEAPIKHLLRIDQLTEHQIDQLIADAKSLELHPQPSFLNSKTITHLFFEPSTRTLTSFAMAAQKLGGQYIDINIPFSSTTKDESLLDTLRTLAAMGSDCFVIRHFENYACEKIVEVLGDQLPVINAGDGCHSHPSQALLDMMTISQHFDDFSKLKVAIVGDIKHSRVAHSDITALKIKQVSDIRVIAPPTLLPDNISDRGVTVFHQMDEGLTDVDVIITLRLQKERMQQAQVPSAAVYFNDYGLTAERLRHANPNAIVMHPGPMNRGIEIADEIADGPQSVILQQVHNGLLMRMAILKLLFSQP